MDLLHHIWKLLLGGGLFTAPIPPNPQRVLDFGTGTGIWAIDFADEFPSATVIGTDLSPIQPSWVPPNCMFYIDDSESTWTFKPEEAFDFIHGRAMGGSVKDWPALYGEIYKHVKPGGWVEIQEYETWCRVNDEEKEKLPEDLLQWQTKINEASEKFGKKLLVAGDHKENMIAAGFVDVKDALYKVVSLFPTHSLSIYYRGLMTKRQVPIGGWPKDPKAKEIGRYERLHMLDAVEPFSLALFSRALGWSKEEITVIVANVRRDFANPKHHMYSYFHFVTGRRPETPTTS